MKGIEWRIDKLGEVCDIAIGGTPSRAVSDYWASRNGDGIPWVSIADMQSPIISNTRESITNLGARHSNGSLLESGTLLLSFKLTIGRISFAGVPLRTNEAIAALRRPKLDERFLYHGLHFWDLLGEVDQAIKGATLNKQKLKEIPIHYPDDKSAQRAIAGVLDAVDLGCETLSQQIAKQERVRAGLLQALLTRGIDENGEIRVTDRPQTARLTNFADINPATALTKHAEEWTLIRMEDVSESGTWTPRNERTIRNPFGFTRFQNNDVLFAKITPCMENGKGCLVTNLQSSVGLGSTEFHVLRPKEGVNCVFLWAISQSASLRRRAQNAMTGSAGQQRVPASFLINYPLPAYALWETEFIGNSILEFDRTFSILKGRFEKLRRVKTGLLRELLSGRVSVEPLLDLPPAPAAKMEKP
jgi:type I restriction enzyme S subunit